jgi:hypothetical protein
VRGFQLLKFIRAEPEFARVRFVIRACNREAANLASRQARADAVLVEPYSIGRRGDDPPRPALLKNSLSACA